MQSLQKEKGGRDFKLPAIPSPPPPPEPEGGATVRAPATAEPAVVLLGRHVIRFRVVCAAEIFIA